MPIHVGCAGTPVELARYVEALSALEVSFSQSMPPKASTVRDWRTEAPDGFVFSVVAPAILSKAPKTLPPGLSGRPEDYGGLRPTAENLALYGRMVEAVQGLEARAVVFTTPPQIPPGSRGRDTIRRFFDLVDRSDGVIYAWEPHGPWSDEEVTALCSEVGLVRCVDPLRDSIPEGQVAYARLGPFVAMGRALADDELEDIAEALDPFREAFCIFDTDRGFRDAQRFRAICES